MDLLEPWLYNYLISSRSTQDYIDQSEWTCLNPIVKLPDIPQIQTRLYRAIRMDLNSMKSLKASSAASFTLVRLFLSHWTSRNQSRYFWWSEIMQQTFESSSLIDIQIKHSLPCSFQHFWPNDGLASLRLASPLENLGSAADNSILFHWH